MNRKSWLIVFPVILLALVGVMVMTNKAQGAKEYQMLSGAGFTYQGQLSQNGLPTDKTCDFRFSLWTESSNGTQVGDVQIIPGIAVNKGYFSISGLDFGNNAFNGEARWLGIEVKCVGEMIYTTLNPRQQITPAPYALAMPGLFTQHNDVSPNVIGGYHDNLPPEGVYGAAIGGGGAEGYPNQVSDHYGTVAGGFGNQAGNLDDTLDNASYAAVGGGENNIASADHALVAGGKNNIAGGSYAFIGAGNNNTAENAYTTVGGGASNNAAGIGAFVGGGEDNTAHGDYSTITGGQDAKTSLFGQTSNASGSFSESGDAQTSTFILRNITTNATPTELFLDGVSERLTLPENQSMAFEMYIVARRDINIQSAGYFFRGLIKNDGGTTSFVPSITMHELGEDNPTWDVTLLASDNHDAIIIQVSGAENANIRWVATVRTVEVAW